jgi:curved DNA-binding protein CbpA
VTKHLEEACDAQAFPERQKNLYADLGLQPSASLAEIRTAYRRAALLAHPDKGGSTVAFHSIALAFEVLSCSTSRKLYDQAHGQWLEDRRPLCRPKKVVASCRKCSPVSTLVSPATKRQRMSAEQKSGATDETEPLPQRSAQDENGTLELMRATLQDLSAAQRRTEIAHMPVRIRSELLAFMSRQRSPDLSSQAHKKKTKRKPPGNTQHGACSRGTDVRTIKHAQKTSYQAQLRIRHLRMYTRSQAKIETALSHQMVLIQVRQEMDAAGEQIWSDSRKFCSLFMSVLRDSSTSIEELGLSVFIYMRADEWIGRCAAITSPVMPLEEALAIHSRLVVARRTSWAQLRAEWVLLMRQTQHARLYQLSQENAEVVADKARVGFLQGRLKKAVRVVERAITLRGQAEQKARAQCHMRSAKEKVVAAAARRQAMVRQQREWAARRQWYRRADLTMEEIMQGPPPDLRH